MTARDHQLLCYQAYLPSTELIYALQDVPLSKIRLDAGYTTNFTPVISESPEEAASPSPSFEDSTGPLAPKLRDSGVSQTIGTSICDPPPTAPSGPSISSFAGYSLQDAIVAASNSNAYTAGPQTSYGFSDIFGNRYRTLEELNRTKATTLGVPKAVGHTFTQQNFHGLWWGAKRIWTGDLLRLKIAAMQLQETNGDNLDAKEFGARSRGVFMRLDALFTVEVDLGRRRKRNECRVSGTLYELADIEWVDPSEDAATKSSSTPLGTDSAIESSYLLHRG
ncbi:hypothetical protein C8J55DRAFT_553316 [Lentinula edodes]|uniref:Cryptic loci regulator 2 C-terminal domain-containing protein n=1 Tax=Lentinula lateritia TaxID=40482 RepID=A0A9W9DCN2_9AGAR|nr:hypothetical protein C8J55DRAFT_553316 [Lentinula edodes]